MINSLELLSCNSDGNMKLKYDEHIITTNSTKIFKWKSETINKSSPLKQDIEDQLYQLKRTMDKGNRRGKIT